jgi:hypothetical protein
MSSSLGHLVKLPYVFQIELMSLGAATTRSVTVQLDGDQTRIARDCVDHFSPRRSYHHDFHGAAAIYHRTRRSLDRWCFWDQQHFSSKKPYCDGDRYRLTATTTGGPKAELHFENPDETAPRSIQKLHWLADRLLDSPWWGLQLRGVIGFDLFVPFLDPFYR